MASLGEVAAANAEPANFDQAGQVRAPGGPTIVPHLCRDGHGRRRSGWPAGLTPERPARMRSNARRDLPAPDGPRISTARLPTLTAEAWTLAPAAPVMARGSLTTKRAPATVGLAVGTERACAVLRPDASAMGLDDLLRDRQPQSGILPKTLMRPVGVEALENPLQRILANPGPVVIDHDFDFRSARGGRRSAPCCRRWKTTGR